MFIYNYIFKKKKEGAFYSYLMCFHFLNSVIPNKQICHPVLTHAGFYAGFCY